MSVEDGAVPIDGTAPSSVPLYVSFLFSGVGFRSVRPWNIQLQQAHKSAQALHASYTNEVYELWHQHISTSAATDEASIASGSLSAQQLEELTRKWVRLMRESRDMLHHESSIAAARAAVEAKPLPE